MPDYVYETACKYNGLNSITRITSPAALPTILDGSIKVGKIT